MDRTMEKKKILLLGAGFTSSNMGLWALATGAITAAWHAHPGAAIHILDYYHKPTQYHVRHSGGVGAVRLINIRFSKTFWWILSITVFVSIVALRKVPSFMYAADGSNPLEMIYPLDSSSLLMLISR